jgi:hypothetical protein
MKYFLAGFLQPFFWLIVLSIALWLTRKWFPRAESILFASPLTGLKRLAQAIRPRRRPGA